MKRSWLCGIVLAVILTAAPAFAASHLWVINEIFSSADGTVQFIELHNPTNNANETGLNGRWVLSTATGNQLNFTANLPAGSTAFAYLLIGTQAFADLPGAPTPDYIIQENFFDLTADDLEYWLYATGDLAFGAGSLPLDGVNSYFRDGSTGTNSPTNFAGDSGSVVVPPPCDEDIDGDGNVGITDLLDLLAQWGTDPGGPPDFDGDGNVGITDLLQLLAAWGPC